ncbi:transglutaminase domain-containing protein [Micrococcales bacterium 31B]|nr:transglutaminase domain-containing protein [Micrococcales bacterium 31B]
MSTATDSAPHAEPQPTQPATTEQTAPVASETERAALPPLGRSLVDALAFALMFGAGALGFQGSFGGNFYLITCAGAVLLGFLVTALCTGFRLGVIPGVLLCIVFYLAFGGLLVVPQEGLFGAPTLEVLRMMAEGAIVAWKQLLTIVTPVGDLPALLVVPYSLGIACASSALAIAMHSRRYLLALLFPAGYLAGAILTGTKATAYPVLQALALVVVALLWGTWRSIQSRNGASSLGLPSMRNWRIGRVVAGGATLVAIVGLVAVGAAYLQPTGDRFVLRDEVVPPQVFENLQSPLAGQHAYYKYQAKDTVLSVTGSLPENARIRIAAFDDYNGTVMDVAGTDALGTDSGEFRRVASQIGSDAAGVPYTANITLGGYNQVWVPEVGAVTGLTYSGARAEQLQGALSYNETARTMFSLVPLRTGDAYTLTGIVEPVPTEAQLLKATVEPLNLPALQQVPPSLVTAAPGLVGEAQTPYEKAKNVAENLRAAGSFSHGLEGQLPSLPGHGAGRLDTMFRPPDVDQAGNIIGDSEQYAVAMAIVMRQQNIPARVVMGFKSKPNGGAGAYTGNDVYSWVEINFAGYGWVAFDPTPDEDKQEQQPIKQPRTETQAEVHPPPPPKAEIPEAPPVASADAPKKKPEDKPTPEEGRSMLFYAGLGVGGLLIVLALFLMTIVLVKASRRRKRRNRGHTSDQYHGGWAEVRDFAADLGRHVTPRRTRQEHGRELAQAYPAVDIMALARRTDAGVFGPGDPAPDSVSDHWSRAHATMKEMAASVPWGQRIRAPFSLRSLRSQHKRAAKQARRAAKLSRRADKQAERAAKRSNAKGGDGTAPPAAGSPAV